MGLFLQSDRYRDWVTVYEFHEYEGGRLDYPFIQSLMFQDSMGQKKNTF